MVENQGSTSLTLYLARCRVAEGHSNGECYRLCKI
jgi:hypothetical protein